MQPKYEEKTFESYFNTELDRRASIYFPFGQVQEGGIGTDASAFSQNCWLWWRLGYPFLRNPPGGVDLREVADEMESHINQEIKNIPKIKANLFFQYKRPELITSRSGSEWPHWNQKYFRYDIYKEQQELLAHLASKFGSKAFVLYASPALESVDELVNAKQRKRLIENTNFRPATDLTGHHRNTYIKSGTHSIACSDPERMERFDLLHKLETLSDNISTNNSKGIIEAAGLVRSVATRNSTIGAAYRRELSSYTETGLDTQSLLYSIVSMNVFRELSGIQWTLAIDSKDA